MIKLITSHVGKKLHKNYDTLQYNIVAIKYSQLRNISVVKFTTLIRQAVLNDYEI